MTEGVQSATGFQPVNHGQDAHATSLSSRVIAEHPPVELVEKRDDHTRIYEIVREVETTHPDGSTTADTVKSYIHEKASGLCYKDATGNYVPSVAEWRETSDGFVIDRCPYRLAMGKTIGTPARYTVEGHDVLLLPAHLIISDGVNQTDPRPLTPEPPGFILPDSPSVLRFPAAFGPGYDLQYIVEKGGFHQNLIIANAPELPEGLDPENTAIHLYTELNLDEYLSASGLQVHVEGVPLDTSPPDLVSPPCVGGSISFWRPAGLGGEDAEMVHAFSVCTVVDSPPPGVPPKEATTEERLLKDAASGAAYVVDTLPFSYFIHGDPPYYPVVWDPPVPKFGPIGTQTWLSGVTYHVTDNITVSGTLTIEGGAFVKLNPYKQISIDDAGRVIAKGEPGNYIRFTKAADVDPDWGEPINNPHEGSYFFALYLLSGSSPDSIIQYCMMRFGICPINCQEPQNNAFAHNIIDGKGDEATMYYGIKVGTWGEVDCIDNLIYDSDWLGISYYDASAGRISNNTIHGGNVGIQLQYSDVGTITDNLLTRCAVAGISVISPSSVDTLDYNGYWDCTTPVAGAQMGPNSVDLGHADEDNPYAQDGEYFLKQECEDLINKASYWAPRPLDGPDAYSTCNYAKRDVERADIGYHYTSYDDTDADGMPDAWEMHYFGDLDEGNDSTEEDHDGLTALEEFWHGSSPELPNTDLDAYNDVNEVGVQEVKLLRGWGPAVYDFEAGPWLTNVTPSAVTVGWWVPDGSGSPGVYYKKESDDDFTYSENATKRDNGIPGWVYEKRLTGLTDDTVYMYTVQCSVGGSTRTSPVCKFRTLESSPSSFTFIVYGDNRGGDNNNFNDNAAQVVRAVLSKAPEAQFVLHVGDFVYTGSTAEQWRQHFFLPTTRLIAEYPLFPVRGNHESSVTYYQVFFDYDGDPNDGGWPTWYHFDYGDCHFVVMDSDAPFHDQSTQYGHLSSWLGEAAEYTLFFGHRPPHTDSSAHHYDEGEAELLRAHIDPLLSANYVEAHFGGHSHLYERWVRGDGAEDIDYFVIGGGGATLHYSTKSVEEWDADRVKETPQGEQYYNFSVVSATPGGCTVTLWNIEDLEEPVEEHEVSPYQP